MRLSLIITSYNHAECLESCVRSILDQLFADAELILIDDGSVDSSWSVCQRFAASDARIRIARQSNLGPSAARNHGLTLATGDYVTFIDGDDTLAPSTLDRCAALLQAHHPDVLIYSMQHLRGSDQDHTPENLIVDDGIYESVDAVIADLLAGRRLLLYSAANKFYLRSFLTRHDLHFPAAVDFGEDRLFNYACLRRAGRVATCSHPGYRYHIRPRPSLSRLYRRRQLDTLLGLHRAKQVLIDEFAHRHPLRDRYLALDLQWEIKAACDHIRQHWSGLSIRERYREVCHLCTAAYPPYLDQLPASTVSLKVMRLAVKHRWALLLYLMIAGRKQANAIP